MKPHVATKIVHDYQGNHPGISISRYVKALESIAQEFMEQRPPVPTVLACEIQPGECFRKVTGRFVYLRINPESYPFFECHNINNSNRIVGVCFNGNATILDCTTRVVRMPLTGMVGQRYDAEQSKT